MGASTYVGDSLRPITADIKFVVTDYDFIPTYGLHVVAGRNFSRAYGTDTSGFILNESAARQLGWTPDQAVGKNFKYGSINGKVIGIIGDFHFESLHQKIVPIILIKPATSASESMYNSLSVKVSGHNMPGTLATLEKTWKKYLPEIPYQYNFLDENFTRLYKSEQRQGTIFTVFACIAILIACLGLFDCLHSRYRKELKKSGFDSAWSQSQFHRHPLIKDFLKLVLIAAVIAFHCMVRNDSLAGRFCLPR
jgi:putative ABC transport system permease protein